MSNTIHTLEWQGKKGVIRLEASYQASLQEKINNLDGDICPSGELEIVEQASLTAYFNGKRLASGWNPTLWSIMESSTPGVYQIQNIPKIGILEEMRDKVQQFLEDTIAQGTPVSVQAFRLDDKLKQTTCSLSIHQGTLKKIEAQKDLPTRREARRRMKAYNDLHNEGGEGYVPHIYCIEERDYAAKQITVCQEKLKELTAQKQQLLFDHATEYCIYQIKEGEAYHGIRFFSSEDQEKMGATLHLGDYDMVYQGTMKEISGINKLDAIFAKCNQDIPAGYMGHSLSVSDVIVLKNGIAVTAFSVEPTGFQEKPNLENELFQNAQRAFCQHQRSQGIAR